MKVSVALAVRNEEQNLSACLSALTDIAEEFVIVDGGSTDRTVEIAQRFGANVIAAGNPPIFHINKQKALDACRGEWILQLDADEIVTDELKKEISQIISTSKIQNPKNHTIEKNPHKSGVGDTDGPHDFAGYYIPRKNFFCGHWLRKGGQYPDYVVRLFRRGKGSFPCRSVHEQIAIDGAVGYLKEPLLHYSYRSIAEYWKKANAYIRLTASEMARSSLPVTPASVFEYCFRKPIVTFLLLYVRHKGVLDGWYGFLFAVFSAFHFPLAFFRYSRQRS